MGNPTIRTVTDAAALARLYTDILEPSFPPSERVTRTDFVEGGASGALDVLAAQDDDGYLGAIVGERFGNGYLVDWLAVNGARRGGGTGSAWIRASTRAMRSSFQDRRCTCQVPSARKTVARKTRNAVSFSRARGERPLSPTGRGSG